MESIFIIILKVSSAGNQSGPPFHTHTVQQRRLAQVSDHRAGNSCLKCFLLRGWALVDQ